MKHDKQERYYAYMLRRFKEENEKEEFKEACRLFWMVKGHLNTTRETILSSKDSYFKRLWIDGSNGAPISDYEEGFEEAHKEYIENENK